MNKKIAIILSGCGVYDGSEIYESTLTFLAIEHNNSTYQCFAPDIEQNHVINHLTGEVAEGESRNVLVESARLARGNCKPLTDLNADEYDGLVFPGGFGVAKNLCNFAEKGADAEINEQVYNAARAFADAKKPVGFICIAPALVPMIYKAGVELTIGSDQQTAETLNQMGARHVECSVDDFVVDLVKHVVSTPAYMLAENLTQAQEGIQSLVTELISMCED